MKYTLENKNSLLRFKDNLIHSLNKEDQTIIMLTRWELKMHIARCRCKISFLTTNINIRFIIKEYFKIDHQTNSKFRVTKVRLVTIK
jgi:hypothetical protein